MAKNDELIVLNIVPRLKAEDVHQLSSQITTLGGKNNILAFLEENLNTLFAPNMSISEYDHLGAVLSTLPSKHSQHGCDILKFFLDSAPSLKHQAECLVNIILNAGRHPTEFKPLENDLIKLLNQFKEEIGQDLNDIYIFGSQDVQHYLEFTLGHLPINKTTPLIDFYNNGNKASPVIEGILRRTYTDLIEEDKIKLVSLLVKHLEELIKIPALNYLFKNAGKAEIYIYKYSIGGGYITTPSGLPTITMGGAFDYITKDDSSLITGLAHESMHFLLDCIFKNDSKPYYLNDTKRETEWLNYTNYVMSLLRKVAPSKEEIQKSHSVSDGYNQFWLLNYKEDILTTELPAFLLQDQVIKILIPDITPSIIGTTSIDILKYIEEVSKDYCLSEECDNTSLSGKTTTQFDSM